MGPDEDYLEAGRHQKEQEELQERVDLAAELLGLVTIGDPKDGRYALLKQLPTTQGDD